MEDDLKVPDIMATHSYQKALSYLLFSIFVLVLSIVITVLFASDVSHQYKSQFSRHGAWLYYTVATIFGLVLLCGSILSLRAAMQNFFTAHKLEKKGCSTDGIIINKWEDTFERRVLYYVSYRFHEDMEAWEAISKSLYRKLNKGCSVPIRYLKHDPSVSRLEYEQITT
jgi:hypothetical protein